MELTDIVGRYYSSVHRWDPTGELSVGLVQRLFLDDLSGAHGAIVLREPPASAFGGSVEPSRKGRVLAFAISYTQGAQDAPTDVFLGHEPGLAKPEAESAVRDLLALVAHQYPVVLELDDSMKPCAPSSSRCWPKGWPRSQGPERSWSATTQRLRPGAATAW